MAEAALSALVQLFSLQSLTFMFIGVIFGLIMGVLPGLGGIITLTLLIPFVYGMDPAPAFSLLLGAESALAFGGAITSILINVPGNSDTVATCWDGFPLTKQGQGARAIYAAGWATALGGVFGAIILVASIPIVKPLVMTFGPSEYFVLAMMGIGVISLLTGRSVVKGLIAGGLGLLLSMVGEDPVSGDYRFTFDSLYLWEGVEFAAFVIGFFAISEMIDLYLHGSAISRKNMDVAPASVLGALKETLSYWRTVIRSSIIGTIIGIIPGVGGAVANVVAYGYEVASSKNPGRFGQGAIEGVIAPQAADNAREGGALIPTISFGIPGSAGMAILLGAFLILGLVPGPDMFTKHLDVTFMMAWTVVIGNLLATAIGIAFAKQLEKIAYLRANIIVPITLVICLVGAYAIRNEMRDVLLAVLFGFAGYGFMRFGFSRQTLIIGLVLGNVVEKNFQLAYKIYGPGFLFRPWAMAILAFAFLTFFLPVYQKRKASRLQAKGSAT